MPVTEFVEVMERAGRNGTRAHLPPAVVRHILAHPAWREFLAERQKEMVSQWEEEEGALPGSTTPGCVRDQPPVTLSPGLATAVERAETEALNRVLEAIPRRRRSKPVVAQ